MLRSPLQAPAPQGSSAELVELIEALRLEHHLRGHLPVRLVRLHTCGRSALAWAERGSHGDTFLRLAGTTGNPGLDHAARDVRLDPPLPTVGLPSEARTTAAKLVAALSAWLARPVRRLDRWAELSVDDPVVWCFRERAVEGGVWIEGPLAPAQLEAVRRTVWRLRHMRAAEALHNQNTLYQAVLTKSAATFFTVDRTGVPKHTAAGAVVDPGAFFTDVLPLTAREQAILEQAVAGGAPTAIDVGPPTRARTLHVSPLPDGAAVVATPPETLALHDLKNDLALLAPHISPSGHALWRALTERLAPESHDPLTRVDLHRVAQLEVQTARPSTQATLSVRGAGPVWAQARSTALHATVRELLRNAVAAAGETGCVVLDVSSGEGQSAGHKGPRLVVTDTGSGFSETARARLFERGATTRRAGHGLGLATARWRIEEMGGAVVVGPGPGGQVEVRLQSPGTLAGRCVWVLDDNVSLLGWMSEVLRSHGATVVAASRLSELDQLEHPRPDLLVLDEHLAEGSGLAHLHTLRARLQGAPVLLCSGGDLHQAGLPQLTKPFTTEALVAQVCAQLG